MILRAIASTELLQALKPQARGEPVNMHVVPAVKEPEPDFEKMRRAIMGDEGSNAREDKIKTGEGL